MICGMCKNDYADKYIIKNKYASIIYIKNNGCLVITENSKLFTNKIYYAKKIKIIK